VGPPPHSPFFCFPPTAGAGEASSFAHPRDGIVAYEREMIGLPKRLTVSESMREILVLPRPTVSSGY